MSEVTHMRAVLDAATERPQSANIPTDDLSHLPESGCSNHTIASLTERVRRLEVAVFDIVLPAFWNGRRLNNAEMARVIDLCPEGPREASDGRVGS
ncbi:hypothetical protein [Acetobacter nitrogenifigens]|uniref:Uncharacterized protein n=1 Tax=Acetobacter nitrogenifigens DSM 23921 = NBRC 105050 TaxID=1120919 RepID=A0A511XE07_9PROT|nr:hypothetical protein [Acetobacter nitrogenifigens]GEN61193.1 hypothetical protein ANI02nite_30770 [Acetobacter nitrogenifigens DSM 23921 = NBRC 105050]